MPGRHAVSNVASISLVTSSRQDSAEYHLLELAPSLVHYFERTARDPNIQRGAKRGLEEREMEKEERATRLCIKGRQSDEAVLCTADQTFTLREMTQSNSLLLCTLNQSESSCVAQVKSNVAEIWELTPVVAKTGRIDQLLSKSVYRGEDEEEDLLKQSDIRLYTPQQVASIVQASSKEMQAGIEKSHVILLDGYYRMIEPSHLMEALQILLIYVDLNSYLYTSVPFAKTVGALEKEHGLRKEMLEAILLRWFGNEASPEADADAHTGKEKFVELNLKAIVRYCGIQVLERKAMNMAIEVEEFLTLWEKEVGPNLSEWTTLELLKGYFITYPIPPVQPSAANPSKIEYYTSLELPLDPAMRLQHLFRKREQWTLQELSPFLDEIAIDAKKRDAVLLKYARTNNVKVALPETKEERKSRIRRGETNAPMQNLQLYSARLRYG